jgi:DNA transposition AAA+ family ATPase
VTKNKEAVNGGIYLPLTNVTMASKGLERAINRTPALPGFVCLYGPSGYGKTQAATYCANKFRGVYVECRSFFTAKSLMLAILTEAGMQPERTLADMLSQIVEELAVSGRPLIIDEVDHIVDNKALQVLRDIHDASGCAILLVGEERFPFKLKKTERLHNRVYGWYHALPATAQDARSLAQHYCRQVEIADDLLAAMTKSTRAVVRRIVVSLDMIRDHCATRGITKMDLATWGDRGFFDGEPPRGGAL